MEPVRIGNFLIMQELGESDTYVEVANARFRVYELSGPNCPHTESLIIGEEVWGDVMSRPCPTEADVSSWFDYRYETAKDLAKMAIKGTGTKFDLAARTSIRANAKE